MIVKESLLFVLKIYKRWVSPILPAACRFHPTCSLYTIQAIEKYGIIKGIIKGTKRVIRCNPFHPGGYDPLT